MRREGGRRKGGGRRGGGCKAVGLCTHCQEHNHDVNNWLLCAVIVSVVRFSNLSGTLQ